MRSDYTWVPGVKSWSRRRQANEKKIGETTRKNITGDHHVDDSWFSLRSCVSESRAKSRAKRISVISIEYWPSRELPGRKSSVAWKIIRCFYLLRWTQETLWCRRIDWARKVSVLSLSSYRVSLRDIPEQSPTSANNCQSQVSDSSFSAFLWNSAKLDSGSCQHDCPAFNLASKCVSDVRKEIIKDMPVCADSACM